ncbi:transposase [Nitrosomonas mobilis]|uniref:Transposase zinc-ribbon domain-containing protein n=1 Tax=Nitrosomonas mobilis TaxID=51642 RepID=A0A1G5SF82_9PROT|nr:transposase [Nitrosomonas mobilis]SCZ85500.1 hypothetical protein NSMM_380122 [Nitrosomonas mobilis]
MAMKKFSFRQVSLHEFLRQCGTETQCEAALFAARWPHGWRCLRCDGERYSCTHNGRKLWECLDCDYQYSSIVVLIWLPWCRDCCAPPQRQNLFRSVY